MAQEKGIARLTFEQVKQLGEWCSRGYSNTEIAGSIGYSVTSVSRFIRVAIARSQIPADCRNRTITTRTRKVNSPLPPLPRECWNKPQESKYTVKPRSKVFYNRVNQGWSQEEAISTLVLPRQRELVSRNQAILASWEKNQNYLVTAREFQLSAARVRRIVIRQLQKQRIQETERDK